MLVVIEYAPWRRDSAERLARLAESLGYRVRLLETRRTELRVSSPAGVFEDPDRASVALARLAAFKGWHQ